MPSVVPCVWIRPVLLFIAGHDAKRDVGGFDVEMRGVMGVKKFNDGDEMRGAFPESGISEDVVGVVARVVHGGSAVGKAQEGVVARWLFWSHGMIYLAEKFWPCARVADAHALKMLVNLEFVASRILDEVTLTLRTTV